MNKITRIILAIFILPLAALFISIFNVNVNTEAYDTNTENKSEINVIDNENEIEVSIKPRYDNYKGYAFPTNAGVVYFKISLSESVNTDVKVYYETRDKSAIASLGDYTSKDTFVTIPANETSVFISVTVAKSQFAVASPSNDIYSREFEVVLTDVVGITNFTYGQQSCSGMIGFDYVYYTKISNEIEGKPIMYFADYEKYDISAPITTDEIDGEGSTSVDYDFSSTALYSHWKKNFLDTGLADLYATFSGKIDDWGYYTYWSYASLLANDQTLVRIKSEGYYDNHPMNPNYYGHEGYDWYDHRFASDSISYYIPELCCDCIDNTSHDFHCYFYKVFGSPKYTLQYRSEGGRDRKLVDTRIYSLLSDTKAPSLKYNKFYSSSLTDTGDKLRVSIRYNEPVYMIGDVFSEYNQAPSTINLVANGEWDYTSVLTYAGGNYTDTIYYEVEYEKLNLPADGRIEDFMVLGGTGIVHDFAYNASTREAGKIPHHTNNTVDFGKWISTTRVPINADLRVPNISFSCNTNKSILTQHSVTVDVSNADLEESKLYYSWETSDVSIGDAIKQKYYFGSASESNTITGGGFSGKRYLHVYVETKHGRGKYLVYDTALNFDNTAPTVTVDSVDGLYNKKTFTLTVTDNFAEVNSGIDKVYLFYRKMFDFEYTLVEIKSYYQNIYDDTFTYEVTAASLGIPASEFDYVKIGFFAVDRLGNKLEIDYSKESKEYIFDNGSTFVSSLHSINEDAGHKILYTDLYTTYVIQKNPNEDLYLTFGNDDFVPEMANLSPKLDSFFDVENNKEIINNFGSIVANQNPKQIVLKVNPTNNGEFAPGLYKIRLYVDYHGEKHYSNYFYFYLSENGDNESGINYLQLEKQYVLNNYVYQLSIKYPNYHYLDETGTLQRVPYASSTKAATFSTYDKAYQYIYTQELLDLYAKKITANEANLLNNNGTVGTFRKAVGDTTHAAEGQIWIRYKRANWDYTDQESSWVWYCYDATTSSPVDFEINATAGSLPKLLTEALTTVSSKISQNGAYIHLVGNDNLDKYGAPKLNQNQIHIKPESYFVSKSGTLFSSNIYYSGDPNLAKSMITYNDEQHYLATNFTLVKEQNSLLYYRASGSNDKYKELVFTDGMTYGQAIASNGLFDIIEASTKGVKEYKVYIDRTAPTVELSYVDLYDVKHNLVLNHENAGTNINAKTISIDGIKGEIDNLSYILLYKESNLKLIDVITYGELKDNSYVLENDHYVAYIYDRSGNFYVVTIRTNDTELNCVVKEQENEYIVIETNREANQIQYFELYIDGELITNVFSPSLKLSKSGVYRINISDWYGNVESFEYDFSLRLPTVDWKYEIDGQIFNYTENSEAMKIQKIGENEFFILSKGLLQFTLKNGYSFTFVGDEPDYYHSYYTNRVKFNESTTFVVRIYYTNNPHVYVTYNVSFDETAPEISASYIEKEYIYEEQKYFVENIKNYKENEILIPDSLELSINSWSYNKISNGQVFDSDLINISFNDGSGIYNIKVYLDGVLIKEVVYGEDMDEIILSKRGEYKIVASDVLGNVSELNFVNDNITSHSFEIDTKTETLEESRLLGNQYIKTTLQGNGEITYLINSEGKTYYLSLVIKNGVVYNSFYYVGKDDNLNSTLCIDDTTVLFEINEKTKPNVYYDLVSQGLLFKVMYDSNNNIIINASLVDEKVYDFECRVVCDSYEPFIYNGSLSTKKSDIVLNDYNDNKLETNHDEQYIYLSKEFSVDQTQNYDDIKSIKAYYSLGDGNESILYIYENGEFYNTKFTKDGFYQIEIENIYGNVTTYYLAMSNTFITTSKVIDRQGNEHIYSSDYKGELHSNSTIILNAFSNSVTYVVSKDGKSYSPKVTQENGQTTITLTAPGQYNILFKDEYGNEKSFAAEIKVTNLIFNEELVYGYSENALKGYTSEKLSINHTLFEEYDISYVSFIYQGEEYIIYDVINENKVDLELDLFNKCIGFDNKAGDYTIIFKDKYGNEMQKLIKFNDAPTLILSRTTRSDQTTYYDIDSVIQDGFWSNMELSFETTASNYEFKVNGESLHLSYVLSFDNLNYAGEIHYKIYYSDEYGNEYEFDACLCREDIEAKILNKDIVVIDGISTTKSNIVLSVDENAIVTYSIDGGDKTLYNGGDLYIDGLYRIEVTDKAGNIQAFTIKKDTYVYYDFYNVGKSEVIINGEVVNSDQVKFRVANSDSSYIEKVFLNGTLLEDYDSVTFSKTGLWEFIISDKMGNKSYFSFYQILKTMQSFEYETPDYYKISEITLDAGDGISITYMDFVEQGELNSKVVLLENGTYKIKITSILDNSSKTFEIRINNNAPVITLIGCEVGGSTKEDVKIQGYEVGDTIYIYKNGKLISKTYISSKVITPPTITEGGSYKIVVESEAGVQTVIEFDKDFIANTAGSVLVVVAILTISGCLFIGLIFRNKLKVDK